MNIAKILSQKTSFGIKVDGYTDFLIKETEKRLKNEAAGKVFYLPLDSFNKSVDIIREIAPDKKLETEESGSFSTKYVINDTKNNNSNLVTFVINGIDPCFSRLAYKLQELHSKGII